jgi:flagellar biosynthetic protein FliP
VIRALSCLATRPSRRFAALAFCTLVAVLGIFAPRATTAHAATVAASSARVAQYEASVKHVPVAATGALVQAGAGDGAGSGAGNGAGSSADDGLSINVTAPDLQAKGGGNTVILLIAIGLLSVVPSLLILLTAFPRIVIILSMARNAVGLPAVPPNQVITGLALFLTLFVMGPTLTKMNETALQPVIREEMTIGEGLKSAQVPLREFMLKYTRDDELKLMLDAAKVEGPVKRSNVPLNALIPAFLLSELRSAFTIGFAIFLPFLVIDLVVAAILQSLGLMMLPPTFVSLPFKVMLFVLAGGWTLIIQAVLGGF